MRYLSRNADRARLREAQKARDNRAEIVKALSIGQISRRDLYKWGLLTFGGLALKNGLSPFASSAYADGVPTGTPPSPLFGAQKFTQPMPRLALRSPFTLTQVASADPTSIGDAAFPAALGERPARRLSYHTDFTANPGDSQFINPITNRGPIEGRPPGEVFAHQRWNEFFPQVGYHPIGRADRAELPIPSEFPGPAPQQRVDLRGGTFPGGPAAAAPDQGALRASRSSTASTTISPVDRTQNGGFGRNETQLHFHNAHNGAESDGAANAHHFPGTFYDYRWSTTLARRDKINTQATDPRASGPDGNGGLINVAGDFREIQGTMWAHDHRFFFTAENVYKGNFMMVNIYSGRDRGNEKLVDGINLRLPSGSLLDYGNLDFDVNLIISDAATDQDRPVFLRHLHYRRLDRRHAVRQHGLCAVLRGAAAEVPLPHPRRLHVALLAARDRRPATAMRCRSSSSPTTATWW